MNAEAISAVTSTILCVDDEPNILSALRRLFRAKGYHVQIALGGEEGLALMEEEHIDLVISDMRMPDMDGAQFLEKVRARWPECIRILLTGYSDIQSIVAAVNCGEIHRYIAKPWDENDIVQVVHQALERKALLDDKQRLEKLATEQNEQLRILNATLEEKVQERTTKLRLANDKLKENFITSIKVFSTLIEMRGGKLVGHSRQVAYLARKIANEMQLSPTESQDVFVAGLLANIGKIGFSDELLELSLTQMSGEQLRQYHKHTQRAEQALTPFEDLYVTSKILRSQHERFDGSGYPDGLSKEDILLGARILAVAVDYDGFQTGIMANRKLSIEESQAMIIRSEGSRYDPKVIAAFKQVLNPQTQAVREDDFEVPIKSLCKGMILSTDLLSHDGVLLLPAEYVLTDNLVQKLGVYTASNGGNIMVRVRMSRTKS
jgi:response regulator RpfG family c-di-GMP phosphodiesterase